MSEQMTIYMKNKEICQFCMGNSNLIKIDGNVEVGNERRKVYELFNAFGDDFGVFRECSEDSLVCNSCLDQLIATTIFYEKCVQNIKVRKEQEKRESTDKMPEIILDVDERREEDNELIRIPTPPVVFPENSSPSPRIFVNPEFAHPSHFIGKARGPYEYRHEMIPSIIDLESPGGSRDHMESNRFRIRCRLCEDIPVSFSSQQGFFEHLSESHQIPCILCETCGAVFDSTNENDQHRLRHYVEQTSRYECNVCKSPFPSNNALQHHLVSHLQVIYCQLCLQPCNNNENLILHMHEHINQRVLYCMYCPQKFRSESHLHDHVKDNHEPRRFGCDQCPAGFDSKDQLRKHQITHNQSQRTTFNCHVCKSTFNNQSALTKHLETHLNGQFIPVHTTNNTNHNNNNHHHHHQNHHRPHNQNQMKNKVTKNYQQTTKQQRGRKKKQPNSTQQVQITRPFQKGNVHSRLG